MSILRPISQLRRTLLSTLALCASLCAAGAAAAAPPSTATAPGRVIFSVNRGAVAGNVDGGRATAAVALPGGGALLVGNGAAQVGSYAAEVNADGSLNPAFGGGSGIASLPRFPVQQVLRQPDGSFVIVASGPAVDRLSLPQVVLIRIRPDGSLDPGFGSAGIVHLPIQGACAMCETAALLPGGEIAVAGTTGHQSPAIAHDPNAVALTQWVVARVGASGTLDPSFGVSGIATLSPTAGDGYTVSALANGNLVTRGTGRLGAAAVNTRFLARLLPSGAPDPTFNAGAPVALAPPTGPSGLAFGVVPNPDGTLVVDLGGALARYTSAGSLDPTFGSGGMVQVGAGDLQQLLPSPAGGVVAVHQVGAAPGRQRVERITAAGAVDTSLGGPNGLAFTIPFGGGSSGLLASVHPLAVPPLAQNSFFDGYYIQRPDGSYLVVGGVKVSEPTGEGIGRSIFDFAAAALTPSFAVDSSFGGPATPLRATVRVPRQKGTTAQARHGIRVTLNLSAPGLAAIVIKARGRAIARNVLPLFAAGPRTLPVELTGYGAKWLRTHHRVELRVSVSARDLLASAAATTTVGALR